MEWGTTDMIVTTFHHLVIPTSIWSMKLTSLTRSILFQKKGLSNSESGVSGLETQKFKIDSHTDEKAVKKKIQSLEVLIYVL